MRTKNVKVKLKDVKAGVTMYVSHPVYGIEKHIVLGKPFLCEHTKSLFVQVRSSYGEGFLIGNNIDTRSLSDMGITSLYNDRRTFFKLKHAEEWIIKWSKQQGFIERQAKHEELCKLFDYDHFSDGGQEEY